MTAERRENRFAEMRVVSETLPSPQNRGVLIRGRDL